MGLFFKNKKQTTDQTTEKTVAVEGEKKNKKSNNDQSQLDTNNKQTKKQPVSPDKNKENSKNQAYLHLLKPLVTEKASFLGVNNQYVFEVAVNANKSEIKKAIIATYAVTPLKINLINMRGKSTRYGRTFGQRKNWKKAIITLKSGDKIDVYEGV